MEHDDETTRSALGRQERPLNNYLAIQGAYERSKGMLQYSMEYIEKGELLAPARAQLLAAALVGIEVPEQTAYRMAKWLGSYANITEPTTEEIFGGAFDLGARERDGDREGHLSHRLVRASPASLYGPGGDRLHPTSARSWA
jgi:hypothetical protein